MSSKAPYAHLDGSPCWTVNCKRGNISPNDFLPTILERVSKWWNKNITTPQEDANSEHRGDEEISTVIAEYMTPPVPKEPSTLMGKLISFAEKEGYDIDLKIWSPQALASQMGIVLESVIKEFAIRSFKNKTNKLYIRGDELGREIENVRSNGDPEQVKACYEYLTNTMFFSEGFAKEILGKLENGKKNSINLPDSIVIDSTDPNNVIVKVGEMKASGENDSSSIPENIRKLVVGTPKSAVNAWSDNPNVKLEKSILITASATTSTGLYANESRWKRELINMDISDIEVRCNSEAYNWLTGAKFSEEEYGKKIINTTVNAQFNRLLFRSKKGVDKV